MSESFSNSDIENIRSRVDIVSLIESYYPLKRSGANYKACCPFHSEKTASFMVSPQKQIYHCFGCHKGGDVFRFLMDVENITFPEAVQRLADKCGYTLTTRQSTSRQRVTKSEKDRLYECLNKTAQFYHTVLMSSPQGDKARSYLEQRGFSAQTLKKWKIGYAPSGSGQLKNYMRKEGIAESDLLKTGLLKQQESGRVTNRFFNRIMFPIFDSQNRIVAFGGRVMDDSLPKYINSPETILYQKSGVLYGFSQSKNVMRDKKYVLVVEGYFDVIQLHQAGLDVAVAPCGTALTEQQITLLNRYVDRIYLAFDADQAGVNAAFRKLDTLLAQGIRTDVVSLPLGEDPDSYVRKHGKEAFEEKIANAQPVLEFRLKMLIEQYGMDDEYSRMKIADSMMELVSRQSNNLLAESWIKQIEKTLGFSEGVLREELSGKRKRYARTQKRRSAQAHLTTAPTPVTIAPCEKEVIRIMLSGNEEILDLAKKSLQKENFSSTIIAHLWEKILSIDVSEQKSLSGYLLDEYRDQSEALSLITELVSVERGDEDPFFVLNGAIKRIKKEYIERQITICMNSLEKADEEDKKSLLKKIQDFNREKNNFGIF